MPTYFKTRLLGICLSLLWLGLGFAWAADLDPDLNNDGVVNILDVSAASRCVGKQTTLPPPTVTLTTPADGSLLNTPLITITGTLSDPLATVTVNGIAATVTGAGFSLTGFTLQEGPNDLEAIAILRKAPPCFEADINQDGKVEVVDFRRVTGALGRSGFPRAPPPPPVATATVRSRVTLDTIAPILTITTPADGSHVFEATIPVAGSVDDATATIRLNGQIVPLDQNQWQLAQFALQPGANTFTVSATDPAGNSRSQTRTVTRDAVVLQSLSISPPGQRLEIGVTLPLLVTGHFNTGATADLTAPTSGTTYTSSNPFVARVDPAGLVTTVADGATVITAANSGLSASAPITVETSVTLEGLTLTPAISTLRSVGATQPLQLIGRFSDGSDRDLTAATTGTLYTSSHPAIATISPDGVISAVANGSITVIAVHEDRSATAQLTVALSGGPGFLRGEVYNDSLGLPLGDATVTLLADGRGELTTPVTAESDAQGRYLLSGQAGAALIRITRSGFTPVERQGTLPAGTAATLLDARLTPLDTRANPLTAAAGGQARDQAGRRFLDLPAASLPADSDIRLTAVSNQGLQDRLPFGWSPVASVDVQPHGLTFAQSARLRLPNDFNLGPNRSLTVARYVAAQHRWLVGEPAQVTADGAAILLPLPTSGQLAILLPDAAPFTPPTAAVGEPLAGVTGPALPDGLTARSEVTPPAAPPGPTARAVGHIVLTPPTPLASGVVVQGQVSEQYDLRDTTAVVPLPFVQDLLLYAFPDTAPTLGTRFPITPSRDYSLQELAQGVVRIAVTATVATDSGTPVGSGGGVVANADGARLTLAAGALNTDTLLELRSLTAADLPFALPADLQLLGAVELVATQISLNAPAILSLPRPANLPVEAQLLIVRLLSDASGVQRLVLVDVARVANDRLVGGLALPGLNLPGITDGGRYLLLQPTAPLSFVTGRVLGTTGDPQPDAVVTGATPFAGLSDAQGRYALALAAGPATLQAALANGDSAPFTLTVAAAGSVTAAPDVRLAAIGPAVIAVTPADGARRVALNSAVQIQFSEPVRADSVTPQRITLTGPTGAVTGTLQVNPDGRQVSFTPTAALSSATEYTVNVQGAIVDLAGNPLAPFAGSRFYTVDTSVSRDLAGRITATAPDAQGFVTVRGSVGTAEAGQAVAVINNTSGVIVTVVAGSDGSFTVRLPATTADLLTVNLRTAAGTDTQVQIGTFYHADGRVTVGALGGTVSVDGPEGPLQLLIPAGALRGPATLRLTAVSEAEALAELNRLGLALPPGPPTGPAFGGALRIEAGDAEAATKLELSVPLPAAVAQLARDAGRDPAAIQGTLVRVETIPDADGNPIPAFRELDSLKVHDGRLSTNSPPFDGVGGAFSGFYFFFPFPLTSVAYINGRIFIADDPTAPGLDEPAPGVACPHPDPAIAATQRCRAAGAVVQAFAPLVTGTPLFYALTDQNGHYSGTAPIGSTEVAAISARRFDAFPGGRSVQVGLVLAPLADLTLRRKPPPPDTTPPTVQVLLNAVSVPLGTPVTVTVVATDNDNRPASLQVLNDSLQLNSSGPGTLPPDPVRDPGDGRFKTTFTPDREGVYRFTASASDAAGNVAAPFTAELRVGPALPPPGGDPPPGDANDRTPPVVVGLEPAAGALVDPAAVIVITFSEPLSRNAERVGSDGVPLFVKLSGGGRTLAGRLTLSADQTQLTFQPAGGLEPGSEYELQVTPGITDLAGNGLDQDALSDGRQPFLSRFRTRPLATPTNLTDLEFTINATRGATIVGNTLFLTDADNAADRSRILIQDATNPSQPQPLAEIRTDGQPRDFVVLPHFSYLGLNGLPTFPPSRGLVGEAAAEPGPLLVALVFKRFALGLGLDGTFLQFYDLRDPRNPQKIGSNVRISLSSIGTRLTVVGQRAYIKLADAPNPGLAVVDLRLALVKATLLPRSGRLAPDGSLDLSIHTGLIDADGNGVLSRDFLGLDANNDGDFNDAGDRLPDIDENTDVVVGRLLTPGYASDFAVSRNGQWLYIADGQPLDVNQQEDIEPNLGLHGPYYGVGSVGPNGAPQADASGGLVVAQVDPLLPLPLLDQNGDGLDDRILARVNTPTDDEPTSSTRIRLAEGLTLQEQVRTVQPDGTAVVRTVERTRDLVFVSNAAAGSVTAIDVTDPSRPLRVAVIRLPNQANGLTQPVELLVQGTTLSIDAASAALFQVDLNRLISVDASGPLESYLSLQPQDSDNNGVDDRIVRQLAGISGNGEITATGYSVGGTNASAQTAAIGLPTLAFVRLDGSTAELAAFDPTQPGNGINRSALEKLKPVNFLVPGKLHQDPVEPSASDPGDRQAVDYVYFVQTRLPAGAGAQVDLTLESLDAAGVPLPDQGYAFPPSAYHSPRPGTTPTGTRVLRLYRQLDDAALNQTDGQRLSDLGTLYVSAPIFLTREPLRAADLDQSDGPRLLWAGHKIRASLAKAGATVAQLYGVTSDVEATLGQAAVTAPSFAADLVDSPHPHPRLNPSTGQGEAFGPVYLHNGEFSHTASDLMIRGRGVDYSFQRRYESQSLYNGPLGRGWDFGYQMRLLELPAELPDAYRYIVTTRSDGSRDVAQRRDVIAYDGSGRADWYAFEGDRPANPEADPLAVRLQLDDADRVTSRYRSPRGFFTRLFKLKDGTFLLLEQDGSQYRFGTHGRLTAISDRNGNRLDLVYDQRLRLRAIVDTLGRTIRFGYYKRKGADDEPEFVADLDEDDANGVHDHSTGQK